ncbi:MAG: TVP38/TMEM64 family protein [Sandaracinaceae bacterium]|nr:TVP38/TMEM64 family protein [Sandaracinaceae bacterium]
MRSNLLKIAVFLVCVSLVVYAYMSGTVELIKDPERIQAAVREAGALGAIAYLVVFVILASAGVPAVVFMIPAKWLFPPWPLAVALAALGGMISAIFSFVLARYLFRDFFEKRIPDRFRRSPEELEQRALRSVIVSRLIFFIIPPINWAYGVSSISLRTYTLGTFIGGFPGFFFYTLAGGAFFEWLGRMPVWVWAIAAALALGIFIFVKRRQKAAAVSSTRA